MQLAAGDIYGTDAGQVDAAVYNQTSGRDGGISGKGTVDTDGKGTGAEFVQAAAAVACVVAISVLLPPAMGQATAWCVTAAVTLPGTALLVGGMLTGGGLASGQPIPLPVARTLAAREVALNLLRQTGPGARVISGPNETPALMYFGPARGTGSLYWENQAGVQDMVDFFADDDQLNAARIAHRRGITHVVVEETPYLAEYMLWVKHGSRDPHQVARTLAYRIADPQGTPPDWLHATAQYGAPYATAFRLRVYEVDRSRLANVLNKHGPDSATRPGHGTMCWLASIGSLANREQAMAPSRLEHAQPKHRRGAVAVICREARFLVIRRSQWVRAPRALCFPGGGIEAGESESTALARELREELAVEVAPLARIWQSVTPWGVELAWWQAHLPHDCLPRPDQREVEAVYWLSAEQLANERDLLESNRHFLSALARGEIVLAG